MTAEVLHDSFSGSLSADVFGDHLGDVDLWGDQQKIHMPTTATELKTMEPKIAPPPSFPPVSPQKPPRTPSGKGVRKTLAVKQPIRRSSGPEGNLREIAKQANDPCSTKGMSRTKLRRLQASSPRLVSPPPPEEDSPPKPLSVAEKRRLRNEALSSRVNTNYVDQKGSDESFPKLGSQSFEVSSHHTGTTAPFDASCSSFSISASNLSSSISNGLNHDMDHSFDLKDMSQSSVGSSFRRRKSSTLDVSLPQQENKGNTVDDLQKHLETVLKECPDMPVSSPRERRGKVPHPPRSTSSPRTPRRSRKTACDQRSSTRDGSVPRAGGKIKFVRDTKETRDDDKSRKSSRSSQSKATKSSKSSSTTKPSRSSSMAVAPSRPRKSPSESKPPRSRSTPSAKLMKSNNQAIQPRSSSEADPSPARRRGSGCEGSRARSSSGTPRRKIKYVKNAELARSDSISKLEF